MSKVLPILFNGDMVRAILDGRKTVTRRICRDGNRYTVPDMGLYDAEKRTYAVHRYMDEEHECESRLGTAERPCPICPGDILYVRETWTYHDGAVDGIIYKARCPEKLAKSKKWRPSIHMPKEAVRIWLKVTGVRVEQLHDIKNFQAEGIKLSEGCEECLAVCGECNSDETPVGCDNEIEKFAELWDATVRKADIDRYGWDANPWVWVIEFERCGKPESEG